LKHRHCASFFTEIGKLNFDSFCRVAMHFLDDEDNEVMQKELKEAFRLYDKDGECAYSDESPQGGECTMGGECA